MGSPLGCTPSLGLEIFPCMALAPYLLTLAVLGPALNPCLPPSTFRQWGCVGEGWGVSERQAST